MLSKHSVWWMLAAFLGGVCLHIDAVPSWASAAAIAAIAWRFAATIRSIRLPGRLWRVVLSIAPVLGIFGAFHTLNGLEAGSALLVVMGGAKLLETHTRRDQVVVIGAALFLLLAACLARAGLLRVPLYIAEAWLCCTALAVAAQEGNSLSSRAAASLAFRSLILAVPLAVILFLFFPRVAGSFWALPASARAETGLSDSMSPGSISELSNSDDIAFRAWFQGELPPPHLRYWRGPVLHQFDGYTWRRSPGLFYRSARPQFTGRDFSYRIALEPQSTRWWYALESVRNSPARSVFMTFDRQLVGPEPVSQVINYEAVSNTRATSGEPLSRAVERLDLQLPAGRNPRSVALGGTLRAASADSAEFVRQTLEYFRTGGFKYTLTPPLLDLNSIDDLLFNTRLGFCGHFASAFVMLMRAGGVPARVVTGYLGGERNPIGGYLVIRQSDAHAWAEVWLEGQGWTRVDPTAIVEPQRLQRGLLDLLSGSLSTERRLMFQNNLIAQARYAWDAANAWWNDQVLNFNLGKQLSLLSRLGLPEPDWKMLAWSLAIGLAAWLGVVTILLRRPPPRAKPEPIAKAYRSLCHQLAQVGLVRDAWQGPLDFAAAIERARPEVARQAVPILRRYAEIRYGAGGTGERELIRAMRSFRCAPGSGKARR